MAIDVIMPKMGESITEGTILEWKKNIGDRIALDETLLEISTDKVDSEVPSPAAGVITELLYNINDVPVQSFKTFIKDFENAKRWVKLEFHNKAVIVIDKQRLNNEKHQEILGRYNIPSDKYLH